MASLAFDWSLCLQLASHCASIHHNDTRSQIWWLDG